MVVGINPFEEMQREIGRLRRRMDGVIVPSIPDSLLSHNIVGASHTVTGSQYQLVGLTATDTLGLLTPSTSPGAAAAILRTDSNGYLHLRQVELAQTATGDTKVLYIDSADADSRDWNWNLHTAAQAGRDNVVLNWGYNNAAGGGCSDLTEPCLYLQLESFYTSGDDWFEYHLNYYDVNNANDFRPLQINISRDDQECSLYLLGEHHYFQDKAQTAGLIIQATTQIVAYDPVYIRETSANALLVQTAALATILRVDTSDPSMYLNGSNCKLFINETANASMSYGVTVNQGTSADEVLAFKNSNVAHGATTIVETDTFGDMVQVESGSGGLRIRGLKDADGSNYNAMVLYGYLAENVDTTKSQSGHGIVSVYGYQTSGTGLADTVDDGNVFTVHTQRSSSTVTLFIVDEDGDLHADGSFDNVYDQEDDALAIMDLAQGLGRNWNETLAYNFDRLRALGVISGGTPDRPFVSWKNLNALYMGAIAQLYARVNALEEGVT
jgi:hypothetical protein